VLSALRKSFARRSDEWIRRRHGDDAPPVTLVRRRLYILPSRAGGTFAALLVAMLLAGLNYGNSLALLLTFALGGFCIVAMNQCHRNLLALTVTELHVEPTFAGEAARATLTLENPSAETRFALRVGAGMSWAEAGALDAGDRQRLQLEFSAPARGVWPLPRLRIESGFPFGLFRSWTWLQAPVAMIVYPAPRGALPPPAGAGLAAPSGPRAVTGLDEWRDLRPFRDGDSPRQVAWKAYARGAPLLVREYEGVAAESLHFDFEHIDASDAEVRLSQLCRWIMDADARGMRYALRLPTGEFPEGRGAAHRDRCLEALARYGIAPADTSR
jgi:uncharacterized protein (DUF58 family)